MRPRTPPPVGPRPLIFLLLLTAVITEACLGLVDGWAAAAVGLAFIAAGGLWLIGYVAGAEVMDSSHRKPLRLVRQRTLSMLGWSSLVATARTSSASFDHAVKPELQRLYAVRLAEKHGVSLHGDPERAAAIVGPELWPWIDPRRPPLQPSVKPPRKALDRRSATAPPPPPDVVLRALVDRLEKL